MIGDFNPCPKPPKREKKQPTPLKRTPIKSKPKKLKPYTQNTHTKKPNKPPKKKRAREAEKVVRDGLTLPTAKVRNSFDSFNYEKAAKMFGLTCNDPTCSMPACEMHHIVFRSQSGRGVWRNAVPLCLSHHEKCHTNRRYADMWRESRKQLFGEHFYKDKYDLWLAGLISEPLDHIYEDFMKNQEVSQANAKQICSHEKSRYITTFKQP